MDNFDLLQFLKSVDYVFAVILLLGGWQWGKYFTFTKNAAWNFLIFSTITGAIYLGIMHAIYGIKKEEFTSIFVTYLFTTSFYELLGRGLLEGVQNLLATWISKMKRNDS